MQTILCVLFALTVVLSPSNTLWHAQRARSAAAVKAPDPNGWLSYKEPYGLRGIDSGVMPDPSKISVNMDDEDGEAVALEEADVESTEITAHGQKDSKKRVKLDPNRIRGVWKRTYYDVPADWKGKFVRIYIPAPIHKADVAVRVNGQKAGDILRPGDGSVDVSHLLKYGEKNELVFFVTESGEGTDHGPTQCVRWIHCASIGPNRDPEFRVSDGPVISDVFCNTSWREKRLRVETELESRVGVGEWTISVSVSDQDRKVVKTAEKKVALKPGVNSFAIDIPWENPRCWELGFPYLYTAKVRIESSAVQPSTFNLQPAHEVRFGFREVWRDGKQLYMNGHPLHMRPCYGWNMSDSVPGLRFLKTIGYNVVASCHCAEAWPLAWGSGEAQLELADREGFGILRPGGLFQNISSGKILEKDGKLGETNRADLRRFNRAVQRRYRNHPSVIGEYVGLMCSCDLGNFPPHQIGNEAHVKGQRWADEVNAACDIYREANPNVLYFSHADGPTGDFSSSNLYLNFTPLQEREEWLREWSKTGTHAFCGIEFGHPYMKSWFKGGVFLGSEYIAMLFGDRAYLEEPERVISAVQVQTDIGGGNFMPLLPPNGQLPMYYEYLKFLTWRTNSRWRGFGDCGGRVYFNVDSGFGRAPRKNQFDTSSWGDSFGRQEWIDDALAGRKPSWADGQYEAYQLGNQDFLGYITGSENAADQTHAFYAGEQTDKVLLMIWDGLGSKKVSARVKVESRVGVGERKVVFEKTFDVELKQGFMQKLPLGFTAPDVAEKTDYTIVADFGDGFTDSLAIEVYPTAKSNNQTIKQSNNSSIALYDPRGLTAPVLDAFGIAYTKIDNLQPSTFNLQPSTSHLIIGRFALGTNGAWTVGGELVKKGLNVLVMAQYGQTWRNLGFQPMDNAARTLWRRDPTFGATDDMLHHWRGTPDYSPYGWTGIGYGRKGGPLLTHKAGRGPRNTFNHAVATMTLRVPERGNFKALVDGEFDMDYSPLLVQTCGKGSVTLCLFDFATRVPSDPAATAVARAVFERVLKPHAAAQAVVTDGKKADAFAAFYGLETAADGALRLYGSDSKASWADVRAAAEKGACVLVTANDRLAKEAGFKVKPDVPYWRGQVSGFDALSAIGPATMRWTRPMWASRILSAPAPFEVSADGLFAAAKIGAGRVMFAQYEPDRKWHSQFLGDGKGAAQRVAFDLRQVSATLFRSVGFVAPDKRKVVSDDAEDDLLGGGSEEPEEKGGADKVAMDADSIETMGFANGKIHVKAYESMDRNIPEHDVYVIPAPGAKGDYDYFFANALNGHWIPRLNAGHSLVILGHVTAATKFGLKTEFRPVNVIPPFRIDDAELKKPISLAPIGGVMAACALPSSGWKLFAAGLGAYKDFGTHGRIVYFAIRPASAATFKAQQERARPFAGMCEERLGRLYSTLMQNLGAGAAEPMKGPFYEGLSTALDPYFYCFW